MGILTESHKFRHKHMHAWASSSAYEWIKSQRRAGASKLVYMQIFLHLRWWKTANTQKNACAIFTFRQIRYGIHNSCLLPTFTAFHYTDLEEAQDIKGSHLMSVIYMLLFLYCTISIALPLPDCSVSMDWEVNLLQRGLLTGCAGNESNLALVPSLQDYSLCSILGIFHLFHLSLLVHPSQSTSIK